MYDPREASTVFSVYAKSMQVQEEKEKEEKEDIYTHGVQPTLWSMQMLEAKRAGDIAETQMKLTQRERLSPTGFKFKEKEYVAPDRKPYNVPGRLKDFLKKRYGRSAEERVELTIDPKKYSDPETRPGGLPKFDPEAFKQRLKSGRIYDPGAYLSPVEQSMQKGIFLEERSKKYRPVGEEGQIASLLEEGYLERGPVTMIPHPTGGVYGPAVPGGDYNTEQVSRQFGETVYKEYADPRHTGRMDLAWQNVPATAAPIVEPSSGVRKYGTRQGGDIPGYTKDVGPGFTGEYPSEEMFELNPKLREQFEELKRDVPKWYKGKKVPGFVDPMKSPQHYIERYQSKKLYDVDWNKGKQATYKQWFDKFYKGSGAGKWGSIEEAVGLEAGSTQQGSQAQQIKDLASKVTSLPEGDQPLARSLIDQWNKGEKSLNEGQWNFVKDLLRVGKEKKPDVLSGINIPELSKFDLTPEAIESMPMLAATGTTDVGDLLKTTMDSAGNVVMAEDIAGTAEDVAMATTKQTAGGYTPGLREGIAAKSAYDIWSESAGKSTGEEKIAATAEVGADLASSYAIASGNPYAMGAGILYKGGKAAWDYLS